MSSIWEKLSPGVARMDHGWGKGGKEVEGNGVLRHLKIEGRNNELFLIKALVHFIDLHILPGL